MSIYVNEETQCFHLYNDEISYVMCVLPNLNIGQLYFGKRIHVMKDPRWMFENVRRSHLSYTTDDDNYSGISLENTKQEYPSFGTSDFRQGAVELLQKNGSRVSDFKYQSYHILDGKPKLKGLPASYVEDTDEAQTLVITTEDSVTQVKLELLYTIYEKRNVIARSAKFQNEGKETVFLDRAMSICMDLPDHDYDWIQFSGVWCGERSPVIRPLNIGITGIESIRGQSSHYENPSIILKRHNCDERSGEAFSLSLVYSGNFLAQAEVDNFNCTRLLMGIHPQNFRWKMNCGSSFQTPEVIIAYTDKGLNDLSNTLHSLFRQRLCRGKWRDQPRPILINNWEATYFDFDEKRILQIAKTAKNAGVELFVLDDGWFGKRRSDRAGLGDWTANWDILPDGISGLSEKIERIGLKFGIWIEPEMVNIDSDLYRAHPDWVLHVPERPYSIARHQLVLDFSRDDVVEHIYRQLRQLLYSARISYVKWDMNRSLTEVWSNAASPDQQGEIYHRYVLGVYKLYEKIESEFPDVLFESCSAGGGRFDPGMLYYAPQTWTSDNTDAVERIRIQYGTSFCYPVSSMGSHVSAVPNHQIRRVTSLRTRADVAFFGTYGYELDLEQLSHEEKSDLKKYTEFMKQYRNLIQFGRFYRLLSPFDGNEAAWMVVSEDQRHAIVGYYKILMHANSPLKRLKLAGLDSDTIYKVTEEKDNNEECSNIPGGFSENGQFYGDELMNVGLLTSGFTSGRIDKKQNNESDFYAKLYLIEAIESVN